jgi:hypothetical protein
MRRSCSNFSSKYTLLQTNADGMTQKASAAVIAMRSTHRRANALRARRNARQGPRVLRVLMPFSARLH